MLWNLRVAGVPKNIFFLTADAYGVLPPIAKLTPGQAMYHFISGYTAKVAGTEAGIDEPVTVFSACFGAPFMPLHPTKYAELLGEKMVKNDVDIWLVNTGWSGGEYGVGEAYQPGPYQGHDICSTRRQIIRCILRKNIPYLV